MIRLLKDFGTVASVSIGLFIANSVDKDSLNVVKAVDSY